MNKHLINLNKAYASVTKTFNRINNNQMDGLMFTIVYEEPDTEDGPFDSFDDADRRKDWLEITHEILFHIVQYEDKFYVV